MAVALKAPHTAPAAALRAAIYVRVSSQQQEREGTSLETQEAACRRYCAEKGYDLAEDVYREVYSGQSLWERRALSKLRDAVRRGEIDVIVVYSVDRLARDAVHLGVIITEAEHAGCAVDFVSEPLDDTPEGQLVRFIKGFAAKIEAEKIRERTGRGRRARVEAGKPLASGRARYGYVWRDDEKSGMDLDADAAPVVRQIFDMALAGTPLRSIASALQDEGVRTPSGRGRWSQMTVRVILGDPLFAGLGGGLRWKMVKVRSPKTGGTYRRCVPRPIEEQIPYPEGTVPPIVTAEEYQIVQERLERNKAESPRRMRDPESALLRSGFIRCAYCNYAMAYGERRKGYYCSGASVGGTCPYKPSIRQPIDEIVWNRVRSVLLDPDIIEQEIQRLRESDPTSDDLAAVDRSLADIDRQQRNLVDQLANLGGAVADLVIEKLRAFDQQHERLTAERSEILGRRSAWQAAQERIVDVRAWCEKIARNIDRLTYAEKRDALVALDVRVTLWRADHEPRYEIAASIPLEASTTAHSVYGASSR